MDLLERETQLSELEQAFGDAASGRGRTVLVTGEAGIGKTSLVLQFTHDVQSKARVLWGSCEALFTPRPLGPFHDVVHALGGRLLERLEADARPIDLFHGLLDAIQQHDAPSVVVLEDLHWADHATLDFIRFLTRRIDRTHGLAVLTFRDDEIGAEHPLTAVIGELPAHSRVRLKLPVLSRATVEQMALATGRTAPEIYRMTGGNPFFVTEVLREGAVDAVSSVREAVLSRARNLSEPARELLDLVSVVPDHVELPVLERMIGADLAPLDECIDRGLLGLSDGSVSFRHELARLAFENGLAAVRRMRMNGRIMHALVSEAGASPNADMLTRLAHHAIAAREIEAIVRYAPAAAHTATRRGAHREAALLLAAVLPHASHLRVRDRALFFEQRAQASLLIAQGAEAVAMSEAAGALWDELGDNRERAGNLVRRCNILWLIRPSTFDQIGDLGRAAIELLAPLGPSDELALAELWSTLPAALVDPDAMAARCLRAVELADRTGHPATRVEALADVTMAEYLSLGAPTEQSVERLLREARNTAHDAGVMIGHVRHAWRLNRQRDLAALEGCVAEAQAFAHDRQLNHFVSSHALDLFGAEVWAARGRLAEAEERFRQIMQRATLPWFFRIPYCQAPLALLRARQGRDHDAASIDLSAQNIALLFSIEAYALHRGLAEIAWIEGDADRARRSADELARIARAWRHPWVLGEATFWLRALGIAAEIPKDLPEPYALQFAGDARGAAQQWQQRGYVYEAGLALAQGDAEAQRDAVGIFESLGAKGAAECVRERMRAQGIKGVPQASRAPARPNTVGLTEREVEILVLLAEGLANADMAERLHRSVRTIEHHVAAVTEKLGASSRQAAVARARTLGILD